jgi:hypothetical protein
MEEKKQELFEFDPDTKPKGGIYPQMNAPVVIGNSDYQAPILLQ